MFQSHFTAFIDKVFLKENNSNWDHCQYWFSTLQSQVAILSGSLKFIINLLISIFSIHIFLTKFLRREFIQWIYLKKWIIKILETLKHIGIKNLRKKCRIWYKLNKRKKIIKKWTAWQLMAIVWKKWIIPVWFRWQCTWLFIGKQIANSFSIRTYYISLLPVSWYTKVDEKGKFAVGCFLTFLYCIAHMLLLIVKQYIIGESKKAIANRHSTMLKKLIKCLLKEISNSIFFLAFRFLSLKYNCNDAYHDNESLGFFSNRIRIDFWVWNYRNFVIKI